MLIKLKNRKEEFIFFIGLVFKNQNELLDKVIEDFKQEGILFESDSVLDDVPFNDNLEQIIRGYHIIENGKKKKHFVLELKRLFEEFFFLVSDYVPPCCYDGRTQYCQSDSGDIGMVCDRCFTIYDLDHKKVIFSKYSLMTKHDFVNLYGSCPVPPLSLPCPSIQMDKIDKK